MPRPPRPLPLLLASVLAALLLACDGTAPEAPAGPTSPTAPRTEAEAAILALTERLEADSTDVEALALRGRLYYESGVLDAAIDDLRRAIRLDSTEPDRWHLLADAQLDNLRSRDAINTMIYAASRFKERMPTLLKLAEFQYIVKRYDDALATLERAGRLNKNEPEVFFMLGQVLQEQDTSRAGQAKAIDAYERAAELNPDLVDAWLQLGLLHEARGNSIAERYLKTATAIQRDSALPYRMLADYYARQSKLAESVAAYDEAIARDPQYAEALYNSGLVLLDMDSVERAARQFETAVAVAPTYTDAHYYRGVASELRGQPARAREAYEQALRLAPDFQAARDALSRLPPPSQ